MGLLDFFSKRSSSTSDTDYFPILTDMHSHILPGIDDGSPDVKTSIELIKGLMALGIKRSIATPHIISDLYRNNPKTIGQALTQLQAALKEQKIDYPVAAAAEYMLDSYFYELLHSEESLLCIQDKIILTEFSYASRPDDPGQMSFAIITAGYTPILAHPERYPYYYSELKMFHRLADLGFQLQLNLLSLTGYYGKDAAKVSRYLLKENLYSYIGTDLHHERHLQALTDKENRRLFEKLLGSKTWNTF